MTDSRVGAYDKKLRLAEDEKARPGKDTGDDVIAPEDASVEDWAEAEKSRPTLPDETADGLDEMDEEVRRQAEDGPLDSPGRLL